jgi:hypothetical protein
MSERDYRLVSQKGVASPAQLQRDRDAMMRRHREENAAAESTVDALMFALRSRGIAALSEPATQDRLKTLSREQVAQVAVRLDRLRAKYPKVCDRLIVKVGEFYDQAD